MKAIQFIAMSFLLLMIALLNLYFHFIIEYNKSIRNSNDPADQEIENRPDN